MTLHARVRGLEQSEEQRGRAGVFVVKSLVDLAKAESLKDQGIETEIAYAPQFERALRELLLSNTDGGGP